MSKRRPFSEWTPLGCGFNVILGDDYGNRANALFDFEDGWRDITHPANWRELQFSPTWFEAIEGPEPS